MGDYLGVADKTANGEMLRSAGGIGNGESVAFSARIQLLVSKLGRSSTRSPRYLIVVS
jgi:myosin-1